MSTCTCGHDRDEHMRSRFTGCLALESAHDGTCRCLTYTPATERTTTMTDDLTPADLARFIHPVPVGATIPGGTEWVNRETPATFTGPHVRRNDFQSGPNTPRWTAEPIEPPKPALPTAWGTTIRIRGGALDGRLAVLVDRGVLPWLAQGFDGASGSWLGGADITDWTVVYDPSAPKADDGLRERVEELAEGYESLPDAASVARHLRAALAETSADA